MIDLQPVSQPNTTALKLTTTQPWAGGKPLHPDPRSSPISKVLVTSRQSLSLSTRLLRHVSEQSKQGQRTVHVEISTEKEANRHSSIFGTGRSECMQMNRCQGGKAARLMPSNWLFPMVTVTNWSPNRSTLNSYNFAVFWRIELIFLALESWRVPLFYSIIFIGKSWGLKKSSVVPSLRFCVGMAIIRC